MIYNCDWNNKESFIVYKFAFMPESVLSNEYYNDSFQFLFLNNELTSFLELNVNNKDFFNSINPEILLNLRKIIKEGIDFFRNYNTISQNFSKRYKGKKIDIKKINFKKIPNDLYFAKYLCFKEAYDLELDEKKIFGFNTEKAEEIIHSIDEIINLIYSEKMSLIVKKNIINNYYLLHLILYQQKNYQY